MLPNCLRILSLILIVLAISFAAHVQVQKNDPECREHEQYLSCGSSCIETCGTWSINDNMRKAPKPCTAECLPACFCEEGYIRDETNDLCVKPEECSKIGENSHKELTKEKNGRSSSTFRTTFMPFLIAFVVILTFIFSY